MASRLTVVFLLVALATACSTPRVIRLDTGQGAPREYRPRAWDQSVKVGANDFEESLERLVLEMPLALRAPQQGWLVRTSSLSRDADMQAQRLLRKSFGGMCRPGQAKEDCLSLLDDVWGLSPTDKLAVALGLSFGPMRESIAEAVKDTLAPQLFYAVALTGVVTWVVLAANPEPVFTKALALVSAVMLIYLGVDGFLELVKASAALKRATDRANTYEELEEAGERFGSTTGPQVARVLILAMTVVVSRGMVGGASGLASRLPLLPHFSEAAAVGAAQLNLRLSAVEQVSMVAVVEGNLVISLAPTAVAMAARDPGGVGTEVSPSGYRAWGSFSGFKNAMGSAGEGKEWHHIVEQTKGNVERFGPETLHNTANVIPLEKEFHLQISAFYSRKRFFITNSETLTVREWLSTQPLESQRQFGLLAIENIKKGIWR